MIRHKQLWKDHKKVLTERVLIETDPKTEGLLPPVDRIEIPLYDANEEIHGLQTSLDEKTEITLNEIRSAHDILEPVESAVNLLVSNGFNAVPYRHIAAKVVDTGDKLDKIVVREIKSVEKAFNEGYQATHKWKASHGTNSIEKTRQELLGAVSDFFSLNSIYQSRLLPKDDIRQTLSSFESYRSNIMQHSGIQRELKGIISNYSEIVSAQHMRDFFSDVKKKIHKGGVFSINGELRQKCIETEYFEALADMDILYSEIKHMKTNFIQERQNKDNLNCELNQIDNYNQALQLSKPGEINDASVDAIEMIRQINPNRYDSSEQNAAMFFGDSVSKFRQAAENIQSQANGLILSEISRIEESYEKAKDDDSIDLGELVVQYKKIGKIEDVAADIRKVDALRKNKAADKTQYETQKVREHYETVLSGQENALKNTKNGLANTQKDLSQLMAVHEELKQETALEKKEKKRLEKRLSEIEKTLNEKSNAQPGFWNKKYNLVDNIKYKPGRQNNPSDDVVYHARDAKVWDVRDFIQADNAILKEVVEKENLRGNSLDDTAYKCMRWVQNNFKYLPDDVTSNFPEEWYFPTEALQKGAGDCEDGTNLIVSLMRNAGVPAYKVKNACGSVDAGPGAKDGGHSWPLYLRESDDEWVILDWCYLPNDKPVDERVAAKHKPEYKEIWFTFNDKHSWEKDNLETSKDYMHPERRVKEEPIQSYKPHGYSGSVGASPNVIEMPKLSNTMEEIEARISDVTPFSCLPLEINGIGNPENFRYYPMRNILAGVHDKKDSKEQFESFYKEVGCIDVDDLRKSDSDKQYLMMMADCLYRAVERPAPTLHVASATKAYNKLKKVIEQAVA